MTDQEREAAIALYNHLLVIIFLLVALAASFGLQLDWTLGKVKNRIHEVKKLVETLLNRKLK